MKNLETDAFSLLIFCATTEKDLKKILQAYKIQYVIDGHGVWGKRLAKNPHEVYAPDKAVHNTQLQYLSQNELILFNFEPLIFWRNGNELEEECVGLWHMNYDT